MRLKSELEKFWKDGDLSYRYRNVQKKIKADWLDSKTRSRKFYIESTRRLGKSSFLLMLMVEECIKHADYKAGFFAPVKEGLLDYIEPLIKKTFKDCPDDLRPKFNGKRFLLEFKNGSVIVFRGSNNQQHRVKRGQEFNLAGVDECRDVDDLSDLIDSVLFPALFSTNGYLILSSTPADTFSHPLYRYRTQAEVGKWLSQFTIHECSKLDPKAFPADQIAIWKQETLEGLDGEEKWEREYECKWVVAKSRLAVPEWKPCYIVTPVQDVFARFYHHYIGLDWGYKDYTALCFATWNFRGAYLSVDGELTFSGTDVRSDRIADSINLMRLKLWGEDASVYRMVSDSADPILTNEINGAAGMNFIPVQKERSLEAMLNQFRMLVAAGKVRVSPKCPMLLSNLNTAVWDKPREKLDQDLFNHHFDHLMALVYLTRVLNPYENPIPHNYGVDGQRVFDLNFDKDPMKNNAAKTIEEAFRNARRSF